MDSPTVNVHPFRYVDQWRIQREGAGGGEGGGVLASFSKT